MKEIAISSFKKSILLHGLLIALLTINVVFFTDQQVTYIPTIKVDIVDLPDKRPSNTKVAPAPVPQKKSVAQKKPPPPPPPQKKARPALKKIRTQKSQKKSETQQLKAQKPIEPIEQEDIGQQAIKRLESIERIKEMVAVQEAIKGNRIMPGTALKGLNKIDYDNYTDRLHRHVQSHWQLPKWLAISGELNTVVKIYLSPEGYIISKQLIQSSGDPRFDEIVLSAIEKASPFPQPEDRFVNIIQEGITLNLKP